MNYLAHIVLSKSHIDYQLGNLLADPLKGRAWLTSSALHKEGLVMHRSIDSFTDSNQHVKNSKLQLGKKGHLKGVVIDMAFDYLLLKNWEQFATVPRRAFIDNFYEESIASLSQLPANASTFINALVTNDILSSYSTLDGLAQAFERIDKRLSSRVLAKESTSDYFPILESKIFMIEKDFLLFFPQLVDHFKSESGATSKECILR